MKNNIVARGAILSIALVSLGLAGCSAVDQKSSPEAKSEVVTILTHDSFALDDAQKAAFEKQSGYTLKTTSAGEAGVVNQLLLNKDKARVDGVYGVDTFSAQKAIDEGVIANYTPHNDPGSDYRVGGLTAIDQGDVCINSDAGTLDRLGLEKPESFEDLAKPEYASKLVLLNPAESSTGLSFLAGTISHFGADWKRYWTDLMTNGAKISSSWSDAYYTDFSGADGKGDYPLVLSYSSSPAETNGATGVVEATCVRQVEYAAVVAGAKNPEGAQAFIDFMLSADAQGAIPAEMYMYPIDSSVALPESWGKFAKLSARSIVLDPKVAGADRDLWIKDWTSLYEAVQ